MMKRSGCGAFFLLGLFFSFAAMSVGPLQAAPVGTLRVPLAGFRSDRGRVVVRLFAQADNAPRGSGRRERVARVTDKKSHVDFDKLPHGTYALFAFHDENENGTLDHNLLGLPKEAYGFSNRFRVTVLSGIPDFEDLKFRFDEKHPAEPIVLK